MGCFQLCWLLFLLKQYPAVLAQTMGFVMGVGELVGGFAAPAIAGWSADTFGLQAPFLLLQALPL